MIHVNGDVERVLRIKKIGFGSDTKLQLKLDFVDWSTITILEGKKIEIFWIKISIIKFFYPFLDPPITFYQHSLPV